MTRRVLMADVCDVAFAMSVVGGKWKIAIVWKLVGAPRRFSDLRRLVAGITEGVLITQLRELEADGIVERVDYHQVPPKVEYSLTPQGALLETALHELDAWGSQHRASKAVA